MGLMQCFRAQASWGQAGFPTCKRRTATVRTVIRPLAFVLLLTPWGMTGGEAMISWDDTVPNPLWTAGLDGRGATTTPALAGNEVNRGGVSGDAKLASGTRGFEPLAVGALNRNFIQIGSLTVNRVPDNGAAAISTLPGSNRRTDAGEGRLAGPQHGGTNGTLTLGNAAVTGTRDMGRLEEKVAGLVTGAGTASASNLGGSTAANVTLGFGGIIRGALSGGSAAVALRASGGRPTLNEASLYDNGTTLGVGALQMGNFSALRNGTTANLSLTGEATDVADGVLADNGSYLHLSSDRVGWVAAVSGFSLKAGSPGTESVTTTVGTPTSLDTPSRQAANAGSGIDERISLLGSFNSADLNNVMAVNQFASSGANFSIGVARSGGVGPVGTVPEFSPVYAGCLLLGGVGWTERRRLRRLFPRASAP